MNTTIAIVHTPYSACTCHLAVLATCHKHGYATVLLASDDLPETAPPCDLLFDTCSAFRGYADWRWYPRIWAEQRGIKVVGSQVSALRVCDNKSLGKLLIQAAGVSVPRGFLVPAAENLSVLAERLSRSELAFPLVVKPICEQGSTGLALATSLAELHAAVQQCARIAACAALVEEYIDGPELELSILQDWPTDLPIIELAGLVGLNDQTAKSSADRGLTRIPTQLGAAFSKDLYRLARRACTSLGIRDYVRFDVRVRQTSQGLEPVFLEANAKPSFEAEFGLDRALQAQGHNVTDAIHHLIKLALAREPEASTSV